MTPNEKTSAGQAGAPGPGEPARTPDPSGLVQET